mmetsp:Transcript_55399/g.166071  ORF Transcript_55399/g.166071 Transcript_55399/m.166071 type:complete len:224 (-) Transcript_55399:74-745(-)
MISTVARRVFVPSRATTSSPCMQFVAQQTRQLSSLPPTGDSSEMKKAAQHQQQLQHRELHSTARREADAMPTSAAEPAKEEETQEMSWMAKRFLVTAEVSVSKIFPAGFGWQSASIVAENAGFQADSMAFAATTGFGDGLGVVMGHTAFYGAKKALVDSSINMKREAHIGVLLGSAAFCSGTAWQPLVDALQGANLSFTGVFAGTWVGCGTAFYLGLRGSRTV